MYCQFFPIFSHLYQAVISKRLELESRGWSQMEGYSCCIWSSHSFWIFCVCIVGINAFKHYIPFFWFCCKFSSWHYYQKCPFFTKIEFFVIIGTMFFGFLAWFPIKITFFDWKKIFFGFLKGFFMFLPLFYTTTTALSNIWRVWASEKCSA